MPSVSIVVPVYNVERYLPQCIEALLAQTHTDFELILVDDGAKDHSGEICDQYAKKDSRIKVIHKPNGGVSSARNAGIDAAIGRYIMFCDSDDFPDPKWVEELYQAIEQSPNAWCFCGCHVTDEKGVVYQADCTYHKEPLYETLPMSAYMDIYSTNYSALLWIRIFNLDIIRANNIRFDEALSVSEDVLFSLHYGAHCTGFSVVNLALYYHRMYLNNEVPHLDGTLPKEMFYLNERIYTARKPLIPQEYQTKFETDFFYRFINDMKAVCHLPVSKSEQKKKLRTIVSSKAFRSCLHKADTDKESWKLLFAFRLRLYPVIYSLFSR